MLGNLQYKCVHTPTDKENWQRVSTSFLYSLLNHGQIHVHTPHSHTHIKTHAVSMQLSDFTKPSLLSSEQPAGHSTPTIRSPKQNCTPLTVPPTTLTLITACQGICQAGSCRHGWQRVDERGTGTTGRRNDWEKEKDWAMLPCSETAKKIRESDHRFHVSPRTCA